MSQVIGGHRSSCNFLERFFTAAWKSWIFQTQRVLPVAKTDAHSSSPSQSNRVGHCEDLPGREPSPTESRRNTDNLMGRKIVCAPAGWIDLRPSLVRSRGPALARGDRLCRSLRIDIVAPPQQAGGPSRRAAAKPEPLSDNRTVLRQFAQCQSCGPSCDATAADPRAPSARAPAFFMGS